MLSYKAFDLDQISLEKRVVLRCPFKQCNARIIPLLKALVSSKISIDKAPEMVAVGQIPSVDEPRTESTSDFYKVDDVWDFDNIGVSRAVENLSSPIELALDPGEPVTLNIERLLICSECDKGPLGFAGISEKDAADVKNLKYFLSCNSVVYDV